MSKKAKSFKNKSVKRKGVKRKSIKRKNVKHRGGKLSANEIAAVNHPLDLIDLKRNTNTTEGNKIPTNLGGIVKVNPDLPPNENPVANRAVRFAPFVIISTIGILALKWGM